MLESLEASLVRIRTPDGRVVGAGFLVGERQVLTCAHVISQALGLPNTPVDPPQATFSLDFPLIPPRTLLTARVVQWCPLLSDGRGDIAGLELLGEPPATAEVVRFASAEDLWEHPFRAFGFPAGYDDGVWATGRLLGRQATDWVMIEDVKAQGFAVAPGFSGTPVWDTRLQGVVGMVVAASRPTDLKAAFVLPLDVLVAAWPLIEPVTRQRIFLSAAPADADFAARLTTDLEARGIVVWTEQHTPGEEHADKEEHVRQAIRAAQAVVLVVSSQTRSSRTVKEHLCLADLYQRRLILVWVGDDEHAQPQHYGWRETIWVDAHSTQYTAALETIEATLSQRRSILALLGPSAAAPEQEPRKPYKGLRAFTATDARDFFGRDRLVDELVKDIAGMLAAEQPAPDNGRLLTIIGPSGSGKSSVVMAGLLPKLQHGALPGSESWVHLEPIAPGKHPIEAFALTLKPHFPDTSFKALREDLQDDATRGLHLLATQLVKQREAKVVLLVDQFEELFTQTESEDERGRFIDLLLTAITEPRGPLLVLLTLRADFYDRLLQYPELYQLVKAHQRPLFPMKIDNLRATIEQPAALPDVQLTFEGNLVGDLLFEMQGQVGALPLLQFTLEQLFERRSGHRLTLQAYREIGGVKGALSQHAEQTYATLPSEEHRRLARALFVRLIDPGATEQDTTRRRAALSEFTLADPTQTRLMRETINTFIAARLLTTNEIGGTTTIEVSHEAVIREWPRLAGWLREARDDILLQQTISKDAANWEQYNKPGDRLYRGSQLKEAQAWARRNTPSGNEVAFLRAGAAQRMFSIASIMVIVLLLLSTTGIASWFLSRPDPTHVITLNDNGPGSLRQAIAVANPGSTITFDTSLRGTILLASGDLFIAKNLTIRGPGASILSISVGKSGHSVRVVQGVTVTISGLTFKDSNTFIGFIVNEGRLTLSNSTVSGNTVTGPGVGGGINNSGTLTLSNSTVSGNTATGLGCGNPNSGGGINNSGTLTLSNSTVSGNTATGQFSGGCVVSLGGGINNEGGRLTLSNSTVSGNMVTGQFSGGGGIFNEGGTLTLSNSTVSGNTAAGPGGSGGIFTWSGTLTLSNSTVSDNRATGNGGGIAISEDTTITQPPPVQVMLLYCTVYGNTANSGGGILVNNFLYKKSQVTIGASIVAGNSAHMGPDIAGPLTTLGYNLVGNRSGTTFLGSPNVQSTDVLGVPLTALGIDPTLRDNGGSAQPHTWTHALLPGSPAIDLIPTDVCMMFKVFNDQRGVKRPQGKGCDSGAYEYAP